MVRGELNVLEERLGYEFKNRSLLNEALSHDSLRNNDRGCKTYQRLEFLGDSVLGLVISEHLFNNHPTYSEGCLTEVTSDFVCRIKQNKIAEDIEIRDFVRMDLGVKKYQNYGNFIESVIGAVYLDAGGGQREGFKAAKSVIFKLWDIHVLIPESLIFNRLIAKQDQPKSISESIFDGFAYFGILVALGLSYTVINVTYFNKT